MTYGNSHRAAQALLFELGTQFGREHDRNSSRFRLHWREHVENSRELIAKGAERVSRRDSVTILGAGSAYNIPLEGLARDFNIVRLVDIDREGLEKAVNGLAAEQRSKIELHTADATAGMAVQLLGTALDIIERSAEAEQALGQLVPLFNGTTAAVASSGEHLGEWKASYVVSSGLSSQAMILPERAAIQACRQKFGIELEDGYFFKRGSFQVRNDWVLRHGELLASLVLPGGRIYWADTIAETPCLVEFGDRPLDTMLDSVVRFLEQAYLNTFLTDKGKQILAHRFTGSETASLEQGDQFLRSFKSRLDNSGKRRLAWAMMTLIAEGVIVPKKELELLDYVLREAERISPAARRPILQARLSAYFPAGLESDGTIHSWRWINDPEATVTLNGSTFYVDAAILKPRH